MITATHKHDDLVTQDTKPLAAMVSTHWGRDNMATISQMTFLNIFSCIGSDNGLAPMRRQAIIWANDG